MSGTLATLVRDRRGAIQVEYAMMAALIGAAIGLGLSALGDALDDKYQPAIHASGPQSHPLPDLASR